MKRKLHLVFCFLFLINGSINLSHADVEKRRVELISVLDEELREVVRLNKQTGGVKPHLMLRMGQILLEKARLIKDQENQRYLDTPKDQRANINTDDLYKESRKYFDQAQKTVLVLLKKFPKFEDRGDAYYILAYNAKELKQEDNSRKFFQKAIDETRSDSVISEKAKIALAEIYFNKGSYDKSMSLYESALKVKRDKWWTKDAFNLAWCYFKVGKFDKAIDFMNESYELSKNNKFIDMSKSIERDIAFFYTEAGKSDEAVKFYKRNGKNVSEVLLKVGRFLKNQGKYTAAEKTLTDALALKQSEKEEADINMELLSLYEKFGKYEKHLEACRFLTIQFEKGALSPDQVEDIKFNVQKVGALMQQQVVAKTFDHQPDVRDKKVKAAVDYFTMNSKLDPKKSAQSLFHAGETYFAIGNYDQAVPLYAQAREEAKKNGDSKIEEQASNALMVSLGKGVKKETSEKYLVTAYESYLTGSPKGEKSSVIYQRLFSSYMEIKNLKGAEDTLNKYNQNFPNEGETQEAMIAKIMDAYKASGDKASLISWSKKIDSGKFKVSPELGKKVKDLTLGLQFEKVEEASSKGDKKLALKGYFEIYKSSDSTPEAKKMAAYNIAVLFYQTGDWKQMFTWADRSISMMTAQDVVRFEKDIITFSTDLFQRRQFTESAIISEKALDRTCTSDAKNKKTFFKNANVIYLAEKQLEKSRAVIQKAISCKVASEFINGGYLDHLNELANSNKWSSYVEILNSLDSNKDVHPYLIYPSSILANEYENIGKNDEAKRLRVKMLNYYENSKKAKAEIPLDGLDAIALLKIQSFENEVKDFKNIKLKFPEAEYNKILKSKFSKLEKMAANAESIAEIGSGVGILKVYRFLIESYENLKSDISNFTPPGKSEDYVKSFKKTMSTLINPLDKQAYDFRVIALKKIEEESILSKDNYWFLAKDNQILGGEFYNQDGGAVMDKAGSK